MDDAETQVMLDLMKKRLSEATEELLEAKHKVRQLTPIVSGLDAVITDWDNIKAFQAEGEHAD